MEPLYQKYSTAEFDESGKMTGFTLHYPENFNFAYDVVDVIAAQEPEKKAVVWCDDNGNEGVLTFGDISRLSAQTANYLVKQGVRKGDRVMLMLKRHFEYWYMITALHKIGAVAIPASHMLTTGDIVYRANAADIRTVVCADDDALCSKVLDASKQAPALTNLFTVRRGHDGFRLLDALITEEPETFTRVDTRVGEAILLYFTSGTTGYPKAVVHNHVYPLAHIVTGVYWHCVQNDGLHLTVADTGWAKSSWGKIYGQWLGGSAIMAYDYDRFDASKMMDMLQKYNVTTFCAPPTLYRLMAKTGLRKEAFASVKHVATAGEALQEEIIRLFYECTGLEIMEGFGQSETTLIIGNFDGDKPKRGSMGKASPLYQVRLVDADGKDVPLGETGEIVIDATQRVPEGLCLGYENNDEATARCWKDGIFHTGDTAYCDAEGYYYYVGRIDDVIKSSGYRIGPFEVESTLIQHPAVLECAVTGVPDAERGNLIKATIVLRPDVAPTDALREELQEFVKERTAAYKRPRIIEFVEELPKTISGKIRYNVIRERDAKK
ncbi:MAG: acetyl-CoA synthetase [Ruminococcus sp.]|nr:acetyl-CoA synthetase [Ruminococcus sp.]